MDSFFARVRVMPWGREEAETYGVLRAKLEAAGKQLSSLDLLIAAQAIAISAVLVSHDKPFARVNDLYSLANWATDLYGPPPFRRSSIESLMDGIRFSIQPALCFTLVAGTLSACP
jgi:hypothetical protein